MLAWLQAEMDIGNVQPFQHYNSKDRYPKQGDPTTVPELEAPPEDVCRLTNTDVAEILRRREAVSAAAKGGADGAPKKMNQWAQRMADRSAFCAAGCPCLKPGSGGPFKMPRLKK